MSNNKNANLFGEDAQLVEELCSRPEDVYDLIQKKREANAQAKAYREKLDQTINELKSENESLQNELEKEKKESIKAREEDIFKIEALKQGIESDRIEAARRLTNIKESSENTLEEKVKQAVAETRKRYPELFSKNKLLEVDNSGFSRAKQSDYLKAKKRGDVMSMLKALRE